MKNSIVSLVGFIISKLFSSKIKKHEEIQRLSEDEKY